MAFSEDDLKFIRKHRSGRGYITPAIFCALAAFGAFLFLKPQNAPQPSRLAKPAPSKATFQPAATETDKALNELRAIQRQREVAIQKMEQLVGILKNAEASRTRPTSPAVAARIAPKPQPVRPRPAAAPQSAKVWTMEAHQAEMARLDEKNRRDKAEADRLAAERKTTNLELMRLEVLRKLSERPSTRGTVYRHFRIPTKPKSKMATRQ